MIIDDYRAAKEIYELLDNLLEKDFKKIKINNIINYYNDENIFRIWHSKKSNTILIEICETFEEANKNEYEDYEEYYITDIEDVSKRIYMDISKLI